MFRRKRAESTWSPYGHEKARKALLATRRMQLIVAALAIALLYGLFLQLTLTVEDGASSETKTVETPEQEPVTLTVTPGRAPAFMNQPADAPSGTDAPTPIYDQEGWLMRTARPFFGLIAPLAGALWLLSKAGGSARGKLAELNFGVYKGAMPLEMHTARGYKRVFTHREVDAHVFGRKREDFLFGSYLHEPPMAVRRMLGDMPTGGEAHITRLKAGGARKITIRRAPQTPQTAWQRARSWAEGLFDRDPTKRRRAAYPHAGGGRHEAPPGGALLPPNGPSTPRRSPFLPITVPGDTTRTPRAP